MISLELHDRVGQDLFPASRSLWKRFSIRSLRQPMKSEKKVTQPQPLAGSKPFYVCADLAYDLRPPGLDEMGIVQALAMFWRRFLGKDPDPHRIPFVWDRKK